MSWHPSGLESPHATAPQHADEDEGGPAQDDLDKDDIADDDDADSGSSGDKQKATRTETVTEWELLNGNKAIWLRDPKEVEPEEYANFYTALSKARGAPRSCQSSAAAMPCMRACRVLMARRARAGQARLRACTCWLALRSRAL